MSSELPIAPIEPNPFWRANAEKLVGESIYSIEEVAKQLILVNSLLEGIYFHALTSSEVRPVLTGWTAVIYIGPITLWLISLISAILTLSPRRYSININSSEISKKVFEEILSNDRKMLMVSECALIASFIAIVFTVWHYLFIIPAS